MSQSNYAPIVLFVYNRIDITKKTVEALKGNELAIDSELYIYSDGAKSEFEESNVKEIRDYIETIKGFKKVTIYKRNANLGLAKNIIDGVTNIVNRFGSVIVIEDDIVTSPNFLHFMNTALDKYRNEKKVWHISGWNYPIEHDSDLEDAFFWRGMNCWGWATWSDRWCFFEKNPGKLVAEFRETDIYNFNVEGSIMFWDQVTSNHDGRLDSWAIFWYATIFINNGLCLNSAYSLVSNVGFDGSGQNCNDETTFNTSVNNVCIECWPSKISENSKMVDLIKLFYSKKKLSLVNRITRKVMSFFS